MHHCGCHGHQGKAGGFQDECIMDLSVGEHVFVVMNDDTDWYGAGARCHDSVFHNSEDARVYGGQASGDGFEYSQESAVPATVTHACGQNVGSRESNLPRSARALFRPD
jgi:hypothetical protein